MSLLLDRRTRADLVKLLVFIVVTTLATGLLVLTIGNISFGGTHDYRAVFADATGVNKGDDVRIAGVKVGTVRKVEITDRTRALITFSVKDDQSLSEATHAAIRYRNLVGQRYVALTDELAGGAHLEPGQTIPISRTSPALDLTVLFNASSRSSRRSRRATSTSSPTRSCRSSRARAARSRACWPTPRR